MNKAKILLLSLSPTRESFGEEGRFRVSFFQRRPFIGLYYLASALENAGYRAEVLEQHRVYFTISDIVRKQKKEGCLLIGIYTQSILKEKVVSFTDSLKKRLPDIKIIVGGPGFFHYKEYLAAGADAVSAGEGEETIVEFARAVQSGSDISRIKGIYYWKDGQIIKTPDRKFLANLNYLSYPDWSKTDLNSYYDYYILPSRKPFAPVITSRGCLLKCSFCSAPNIWRGSCRNRSIKDIVGEIDNLVSKYRVRFIIFQDDMLSMDSSRIEELSCAILEKGYRDLKWMCILHPLSLGRESLRLMALMKKAGCRLISFGLQSANPDILRRIKRSPREPIVLKTVIENASEAGILTAVDFIFGLPGETRETIRESTNYVKNTQPDFVNFHTFSFMPGSELTYEFENKGYKSLSRFNKSELEIICRNANLSFYSNPVVFINTLKITLKYLPEKILPFAYDSLLNIFNLFKKGASQS